jgi:transcriptional antiterminator Rof (Rho-off)
MKFISPLRRARSYSSITWYDSQCLPGVRFAIRQVSLAQRIELAKSVRELVLKHEFLKAGDAGEQLEASLADLLARRLYLEWGVTRLEGLKIDGADATLELLIDKGPEELSSEIFETIRGAIGLSDEERKNF